MREDPIVVILKSRKDLIEHGHTIAVELLDNFPAFEDNPILCKKTGPTIFTVKHQKLLFDFMIEKFYKEDEARELFPECFI